MGGYGLGPPRAPPMALVVVGGALVYRRLFVGAPPRLRGGGGLRRGLLPLFRRCGSLSALASGRLGSGDGGRCRRLPRQGGLAARLAERAGIPAIPAALLPAPPSALGASRHPATADPQAARDRGPRGEESPRRFARRNPAGLMPMEVLWARSQAWISPLAAAQRQRRFRSSSRGVASLRGGARQGSIGGVPSDGGFPDPSRRARRSRPRSRRSTTRALADARPMRRREACIWGSASAT